MTTRLDGPAFGALGVAVWLECAADDARVPALSGVIANALANEWSATSTFERDGQLVSERCAPTIMSGVIDGVAFRVERF